MEVPVLCTCQHSRGMFAGVRAGVAMLPWHHGTGGPHSHPQWHRKGELTLFTVALLVPSTLSPSVVLRCSAIMGENCCSTSPFGSATPNVHQMSEYSHTLPCQHPNNYIFANSNTTSAFLDRHNFLMFSVSVKTPFYILEAKLLNSVWLNFIHVENPEFEMSKKFRE